VKIFCSCYKGRVSALRLVASLKAAAKRSYIDFTMSVKNQAFFAVSRKRVARCLGQKVIAFGSGVYYVARRLKPAYPSSVLMNVIAFC